MATTAWYEIKLKDNFTPGIKNAEKQVDNFEKKINNLNNNSNNLGSTFKGVFGGTLFANFAMKAGSAIKEVTQDIITLGFEMEKTRITMKTLLGGDANFSNNMIGDFQKFAKETPFSTKDVVEGARRLAAYQFQAEQMIPTMKKLGDVSAGLGLNLNDLIWVYGTTKVAGKVNARDIRQFQDRGIPITEYIAKATGKTQKEVLGGLKDIDFKDVSKAFDLMTQKGGPFFNLMEQLSKSVGGQWERLKDNVEIVMTDFGERLLPYLSEGINLLDSWVEAFDRMNFNEWTEPLGQIWNNLKDIGSSLADVFNLQGLGGDFLGALRQLTKDVLLMTSSLTAVIDYVSKRAAAAGTSATWDRSMTDEEIDSFYKNNPGKDLTFENVLNSKLQQAADTWSGKYSYGGQNNFFGKSQGVLPATLYGPNSSNGLGYVSKAGGVTGSGSDGTDIGAEKIHSATRNITINIDTLVGEITFEQSITENTQKVIDAVKKVLLTAVNDVNLVSQ